MKFIAEKMLGKLCKWLRILGYDCIYFTDNNKQELIYASLRDDRIILTRDSQLAQRRTLKLLFIKSELIKEQLKQISKDLKLKIDEEKLLSRCLICNRPTETVKKESIKKRIPEYIYDMHELFSRCAFCDKIYWRGTHWNKIIENIREINNNN